MHSKKDDAPKAGKSSSRSNILPVTVPAGGAAYNPPTVNAKPTQHELTSVDKSASKKASGGVAAGPDEKDLKYLAAHSQILRASHGSHGGFSQISQSSTPISCTPRPLSAVPYPVVSSVPRPQSEYGTWAMVDRTSGERPRESDRPRKFEEDKIHKLCQLVTVTAGTFSRDDTDDLMLQLPHPSAQKQVQTDPKRKRNVEDILQAFVEKHQLRTHHERGTSSSPFDRNVLTSHSHDVHSHEVDCISRAKAMTSHGDLPQRPAHPPAVTRRSGEFERGLSQAHRSNVTEHNFAQTYPVNASMTSLSLEPHHTRRPSFDGGRNKDDQLFPFDHEQPSDNDAGSEGGFDHGEDSKEEIICGSPAHVHLTGQPFAHQQRLVQPVPALNFSVFNSSKSHDTNQRSVLSGLGGPLSHQQSYVLVQNEEDSGSLSARSNGSASIGKGPSAFSPRG